MGAELDYVYTVFNYFLPQSVGRAKPSTEIKEKEIQVYIFPLLPWPFLDPDIGIRCGVYIVKTSGVACSQWAYSFPWLNSFCFHHRSTSSLLVDFSSPFPLTSLPVWPWWPTEKQSLWNVQNWGLWAMVLILSSLEEQVEGIIPVSRGGGWAEQLHRDKGDRQSVLYCSNCDTQGLFQAESHNGYGHSSVAVCRVILAVVTRGKMGPRGKLLFKFCAFQVAVINFEPSQWYLNFSGHFSYLW